jgi:hypothetical protein
MTNKAKTILQKMNKRQAMKQLANPKARTRVLDQFNRSTLDVVAPVGGNQEIKVLRSSRTVGNPQKRICK